jgi:hypothetical protein
MDYRTQPLNVLESRLRTLAEQPTYMVDLAEYVLVEQEIKRRLDITEPLHP